MKVVSLIPARGGSKGIPCKPLYPVNNKPMIDYAISASVSSNVDETWVSTEDARIKRHIQNRWSVVKICHRPIELATDISSIEDVIAHFTTEVFYDILMLIQCTSPMIHSTDINRALSAFDTIKYDSAMSVYSMEDNDMLFWSCDGEYPMPANYNPKNRGRRQERRTKNIVETGMFYITTREQFLKSGCRIGERVMPVYIPFWRSFEIDDMEDLINIEKLMV